MKKIEITKGEFVISRQPEIDSSDRAVYRISTETTPTREELKANKELIADAFNTFQKTGMLPSEMAYELPIHKEHTKLISEVTEYTSINKVGRPGQTSTKCLIGDHKKLQQQNEALKEALSTAKNYCVEIHSIAYKHRSKYTLPSLFGSLRSCIEKALSQSRKEETNG